MPDPTQRGVERCATCGSDDPRRCCLTHQNGEGYYLTRVPHRWFFTPDCCPDSFHSETGEARGDGLSEGAIPGACSTEQVAPAAPRLGENRPLAESAPDSEVGEAARALLDALDDAVEAEADRDGDAYDDASKRQLDAQDRLRSALASTPQEGKDG